MQSCFLAARAGWPDGDGEKWKISGMGKDCYDNYSDLLCMRIIICQHLPIYTYIYIYMDITEPVTHPAFCVVHSPSVLSHLRPFSRRVFQVHADWSGECLWNAGACQVLPGHGRWGLSWWEPKVSKSCNHILVIQQLEECAREHHHFTFRALDSDSFKRRIDERLAKNWSTSIVG